MALEVGTEGKLGGQAKVQGVGGTWKDLTESVNQMGSNLTGQVRNIAEVTTAVAKGDLSRKITVDVKGEILELKNTINTMVDQLNSFGSEVFRVAREVGSEGKLGGQAEVKGVEGLWKDLTDSVNIMASNLTSQVRNIAEVTTAVANGDLSRKIEVDVKGEILELKNTINTMVDQLRAFASEVTRVAREVGTDGKLGGQAFVPGVAGTWKDLTDSVNQMAGNLTAQVRNIADVAIAVANGDMSRKITVDVRGEILQLKETLNTMVDQLRAFASEVTRVPREVEERLASEKTVIQLNSELQQNNMHLKSVNEELDRFAYVASHDLQEPLRKIKLFSDLLIQKKGNVEEMDKYLTKIRTATERMHQLINDLLQFSRHHIDDNDFVDMNLNNVVKEALGELEIQINQNNAKIIVDKLPSACIIPSLMRRVFYNVINNALKFRKKEIDPSIHIKAESNCKLNFSENGDAQKQLYCKILITDNGIGFDKKYADDIFIVFKRLHSYHEIEGTGIGLSICKKIMERHNGHIYADSEVGKGSVFTIAIPEKF